MPRGHSREQDRGRDEIEPLLSYLGTYVVEHFRAEEALMERIDYPRRAAHAAMHEEFLGKWTTLTARFVGEGGSAVLARDLQRVVVDWLIHHIGTHDRAIGRYLKYHESTRRDPNG